MKHDFPPLEIGDVVKLSGHAQHMTVRKCEGDEIVCRWYDRNGDLNEAEFLRAEIVLFLRRAEMKE